MISCEWSEKKSQESVPSDVRKQVTHQTVAAVRNLLVATKEERSKRGKYFKYSPELRDEIAEYAIQHSLNEACKYWSEKLRCNVSESSVRNFIKNYKSFSSEVKEEIGKHALLHGVDRAVEAYTDKLGCEVRKGLVKKFKKGYLKQINTSDENSSDLQASGTEKRSPNMSGRQKRCFSYQMKDEIGRYASQYGITAAIQHYSEKLQFSVKESTVRKFKKQFLDRGGGLTINSNCEEVVISDGTVLSEHQPSNGQATVDVLHPSLSVLNTSVAGSTVNVSTPSNFVYQHPYSLNVATGGGQGNATVLPMNPNGLAFHQTGVINQNMASLPYQQQPGTTSSVIMNQSFTHQAPQTFQQNYVGGFAQPAGAPQPQIAPLSMTHPGGVVTSMSHSSSPLSLTMGAGSQHIGQLNHASTVNQAHHHISNAATLPNSSHQLVTTSFHQPLATNLTFDSTGNLQAQASVSLSNEPLSLMKEPQQDHLEDANIPGTIIASSSVANVSTSAVPLNHTVLAQLGSSPHEHQQQQQQQQQDESILGIVESEVFDEHESSPVRPKKLKKQHDIGLNKRGNYVSYSPELRAEIGRYAAERGNLAAINYFKDKLGLEIPESTVRGLKDKYHIKRMRGEKEVTSLGFAQRGRPMRLGQYDDLVQECIRELVKGGEKVEYF